jgi:hypothetical protein
MTKSNVNTQSITSLPSRQVLEDTPNRVLPFLSTLSTKPHIRALFAAAGYTQADHEEGWKLFFVVAGASEPPLPVFVNSAATALAEIVAWHVPGFVRARAALKHKYLAQAQFVFGDLHDDGPAIVEVSNFLDRLDALAGSPARKARRKADHAALALLAERGIDEKVRAHLRARIVVASTDAGAPPAPPEPSTERKESLVKLYRWFEDWSSTGLIIVPNRADLILLGIKRRRPRAKKSIAQPPMPVEPVAPVATPAAPGVAPAPSVQQIEEEEVPPSRAA